MTAYDEWLSARARAREDAGLTRRLVPFVKSDFIDLAGNDYLGLSQHPEVIKGAVRATEHWGAGAGASRLVTGTLPLHDELERALADFVGAQAGLVFSTGYHANLSVLSGLVDQDTLVVSDAHVHASMIDGCRLARARVQVAAHADVRAVEQILASREQTRALVLTESIYSVLGDAAPLSELLAVCQRTDALLVVDEAHGLGVAGADGSGLARGLGLNGHPNLLITATLSKSLGAQGGVVLGSTAIREQLVNTARPLIFDTGLAPAAAGAALSALNLIVREPNRVRRVNEVASILADACRVDAPADACRVDAPAGACRIDAPAGACRVDAPAGAVLAVPMPSPQAAVAAVEKAAANGVRIGCFRPPSTPDGISRLRLTAHADITDADLAHAIRVLAAVAR